MTTMTVASRHASKPPLLQASKLQLFESQDFPRAPVDPPVYGLGATVLRAFDSSSHGPWCMDLVQM